tara:strand:- start:53 stop:1636 length:1584 start_codon:yes stop_codon:yes gene_type:complete
MKIISLILILFFFGFNAYSDQDSRNLEIIEKFEKDLKKRSDLSQLDDKRINDIIKEIQKNPSKYQKTTNEDWLKKLRPFIVPLLIVLYLIFRSDDKATEKPKKKRNNQSKIDEFIRRSNEKNKNQDNKSEDEFEKNFNDYFEIEKKQEDDQPESSFRDNLKIKIEERQHENSPWYFIIGFGTFNLESKYFKLIDKDDNEAKFTFYVLDITDEKDEIALQGLIDPFKDENYLLSMNRSMRVEPGYGYFEWTPMFLFPKTQLIPPYRGERKLKFKLFMTNKKAKFEKGNIINKKDLYYSTEFIFNLNFEEPGYLEEDQYEDEVNEKIVQLGLAVAYSEKKINQKGVEAIKSWINQKVILKNYFLENTEEENKNKIKYSFLLKNTYELLRNNKLSLSEIVKELNHKSTSSKKYDAMNLLLNIAGSDDRLSSEEDKLLNQTARALEIDMERFQQMKTSTIANIDNIEENNDDNDETIFNFSPDMSNADKCKKLREEYTRWNRQTNNSNQNIKNQAKKMVELTAKLRKKYNC